MSQITVSLDTAKKLKQLGWKKETYLVWVEGGKLGQPNRSQVHTTEVMRNRIVTGDAAYTLYSAPTTEEILQDLYDRGRKPLLWIYPNAGMRTVQLDEFGDINDSSQQRNEENIAEGVAKYRLRCKENGYI